MSKTTRKLIYLIISGSILSCILLSLIIAESLITPELAAQQVQDSIIPYFQSHGFQTLCDFLIIICKAILIYISYSITTLILKKKQK